MIGKKINQLATELAPVSTDLTIIGDPISGVSKKITLAQLGAIFSGAVSFYTNLAGFPATGDINVIYCAKDTQKLYLWNGSAYTEVFPSQALLDTYQLRSEKGVSNGYASLDSAGKVPISQLPSSIMEYKGTWNAATNTPTLANGTGDTGDVYICNVAGTVNFGAGAITFAVGDYVIYSGSIWQRSSGAVGTVTSVAVSRSGDALAITGSPITTSGTINIGFAGTGAQYIKGDGTLATFPSTISQAEKLITEVYNSTGATLTKGTIVYINGGQGNLPTVTKALATGDSTSAQTFGVVQADITNNNNGYVVVAGKLSDLDTQAYTEGTQLYLSSTTAGTWTSTKQYAPNHLVYVGIVVRAHPTQGIVEIKIQNGYEMDELHNVSAQSPDNNDILQYKTSTSLWTKVAGTTSNIAEGSNLYYTDARSRAALSFTAGSGAYNSITGVITIPTNTNQLTNGAAYITLGSLSAGAGISYNNTTGVIASTITQYTDAMARASISLTTTGTSGAATYNSTTGVLNVPQYAPDLSGYVPTSRTLTINGTAYDLSANRSWSVGTVTSVGLSSATSGVTIGSTPVTTSGTITLAIATASGSQQGLLSSTDWTTFNNKQNALTNPVTGTGTTNYLPKFTGTSTIGNSKISESGNIINIDTTNGGISIGTSGTNDISWGTSGGIKLSRTNVGPEYALSQRWTGSLAYVDIASSSQWNGGVTILPNGGGNVVIGNTSGDGRLNVKTASALSYSATGYNGSNANIRLETGGTATTGTTTGISLGVGGSAEAFIGAVQQSNTYADIVFQSFSPGAVYSEKMRITNSGNLGLGVTPSNAYADSRTFEIGANGILWSEASSSIYNSLIIGLNFYYNAGGTAVYKNSSIPSSRYIQYQGSHQWSTAPSGTAGNAISFTQAMTLNASGVLLIGTTSSPSASTVKNVIMGTSSSDAYYQFTNGSGGGGIIGSNSGAGINFYTFTGAVGSETYTHRMLINSSGNVGIGSPSPFADTNYVGVYIGGSSGGQLNLGNSTGGAANRYLQLQGDATGGYIQSIQNQPLYFYTNATERMRITSGGNVGIGSTSPSYLLDVVSNQNASTILSVGNTTSNTAAYSAMRIGSSQVVWLYNFSDAYTTSGRFAAGTFLIDASSLNGININSVNSIIALSTSNTERMRITSGGNVGIGVTSVNGLLSLKANKSNTPILRFQNQDGGPDSAISTYTSNAQTYTLIGHNIYVDSSGNAPRFNTSYPSCGIAFDEGDLRFLTGNSSANASSKLTIASTGAATFSSTIQTASPSSGSAHAWKLGSYAAGGTGTATGVIYIEVNGQIYSIPALLGTP